MVSSSTSICPASTRWDSKMSLSSSLPVCVASQGKSVHQCSHGNSIMTNRAKGLRRWSRECIHRTWFMQPICSLHGNCEWELNMSKNWNSSRKESQQVSFLRFWASSWIRYWLLQKKTSTERRSADLRWTFAAIAQWHSRRCSRNMPSTMKQSAWPFLSQCRQWLYCI